MNQLVMNSQAQTMTSREMAELTEKRHDSVKRTIDMLNRTGLISDPQHVEYLDTLNRPAIEYAIGKRDSYVVVAQLSPEFTARLVDRWQELETKESHNLKLSTLQLLELGVQSERERIRLTAELEAAAPALDFVRKYVDASSGSKRFREVCKLLGAKENAFWQFLEDEKIMYRLRGRQTPYACHLDAGRFEVTAGINDKGHAFNNTLFTPKGINWIAGEWAKYQIKGQV